MWKSAKDRMDTYQQKLSHNEGKNGEIHAYEYNVHVCNAPWNQFVLHFLKPYNSTKVPESV
jgi:hypothetical protein